MWNVCWNCGAYRADKLIDPKGPAAVCPECSHRHMFKQMPLLLVSGASGAGKSTVCQALLGRVSQAVVLDCDVLWQPVFDDPTHGYRGFFETWLRLCKNIGQAGRPVVLFGAGVGVAANLDDCVEQRYFSGLHYLALWCDDDVLAERLRQRPAWRNSGSAEFVLEQVQFNQWLRSRAAQPPPSIELIDATGRRIPDTVQHVASWIKSRAG